jgi:hypothetical protein
MSVRYEDRPSDSDALLWINERAFLTECLRVGVDELLAVS